VRDVIFCFLSHSGHYTLCMKTWTDIYDEAVSWIASQTGRPLLFRGHANVTWQLLPSIARMDWVHKPQARFTEHNAYFQFVTRAGSLLPDAASSWAVAFAMQHHGMPTRLLDWSDTFGVALHFAIGSGSGDAAVWMMNPFILNKLTIKQTAIWHPTEIGDYAEMFIFKKKQLDGGVAAILPLRHHPRIFNQHGAFTVQADIEKRLEVRYATALKKLVIPASVRVEARRFLELAGITEFSLFPDLDGLARELSRSEFGQE
jgi:hypothetical protein